jgi:hypothetical protein
MADLYTQWIFSGIPCPGGTLAATINRNNTFYNLADGPAHNGSITLAQETSIRALTLVGKVRQSLSDEDGAIAGDEVELAFSDVWRYTGVDDLAAPIDEDLEPENSSLLTFLFGDEGATYTLWLAFTDAATDATEIYFSGDIDPAQIPYDHTLVHRAHTADEQQRQRITVKARSVTDRLKLYTVATMLPSFQQSDMVAHNVNFYGGFTPADEYNNSGTVKYTGPDWDSKIMAFPGYLSYVDVAGYGKWETHTGTFPAGTSGVRLTKIIETLAETAGFDFTPATDYEAAFEGGRPTFNNTTNAYNAPTAVDDGDVCVCYQTAFGLSHNDGGTFENPVAWTATTTLAEVLRAICYLTGTYVSTTIDQTSGRQRLKLKPRRADMGDFPESLTLQTSKEAPRRMGKTRVEIKTRAADGAITVPAYKTGDAIGIEMPFRVRQWGNEATPTWNNSHMLYNTKWEFHNQDQAFRRFHGGEPAPGDHPEGWVAGAYLYYYHSTNTNVAYPDHVGTLQGTYAGFHMLQSWTEKPGTTTNRYNTLYGPAQYYAREMLGVRKLVERTYIGFRDDSGSIAGLRPGLECSFWLRGAVRTFRAYEVEIDPMQNTTSVKWMEKPADYAALADYPARYTGEGAQTSGASGASNTSGGVIGSGGGSGTTTSITAVTNCRVRTVASITLSGEQTINGVAVVTGNKVLVADQTAALQNNGVYAASTGAWERIETEKHRAGHLVTCSEGTLYANSVWHLDTNDPITLGTSELVYSRVDGAVTGTGTTNKLPLWTGSAALGDSRIDQGTAFGEVAIISESGDSGALLYLGGEPHPERYTTTNDILEVHAGTSGSAIVASAEDGDVIDAESTGDGHAGHFRITASGSTADAALKAEANHSGHAAQAYQTGTGRAMRAEIANVANTSAAFEASTTGLGPAVYVNGALRLKFQTISAATTLTATAPSWIEYDASGGAFTIKLPPAADFTGRMIIFQNIANSATTLTIQRADSTSDTINGVGTVAATSITVATSMGQRRMFCNGTNWYIW